MKIAACLLLLSLAACSSDCSVAIKDWSPEEQRQMADEIDTLPKDSLLPAVVEDYAKLRREVR